MPLILIKALKEKSSPQAQQNMIELIGIMTEKTPVNVDVFGQIVDPLIEQLDFRPRRAEDKFPDPETM